MTTLLKAVDIKKFLPHRYPFLLVDSVLSLVEDKSLVAVKNVTLNEPFFMGHFPNRPVMPGVLIIEALAQAAGILVMYSRHNGRPEENIYFLVGIDKARFKRVVEPGDQMILEIETLQLRKKYGKFAATARVGDQVACVAEITVIKDQSSHEQQEQV